MKLLIIIAVLILYKYFWNIDNLNIEKLFGYNMNGNKKKQFFTPYKKINNKTDSIYGENGMDTSLYQKDTIYDKLVDIFTKKENQYNDCTNNAELEDWQREINMTFKLITTHNIIFNRDSIPVIRYFQEIDKDNTLLPIAQSAIDIFNEKANKTSIITDIKNIETLETEDQIQYTFDLFLNYPTIDKNNVPLLHRYLGEDYLDKVIIPEVISIARGKIAERRSETAFSKDILVLAENISINADEVIINNINPPGVSQVRLIRISDVQITDIQFLHY